MRLKMTSEGRVCLGLADVKRYGVPYFGRSDVESVRTKREVVSQEQKVSDWQMNAWTLRACDIVRAR